MIHKLNDVLLSEDMIDSFFLRPPHTGVALWVVTEPCEEHKECWIARCGVFTRHTSQESFVLIDRNGDDFVEMKTRKLKIESISKHLANILDNNPQEIWEVAEKAEAYAKFKGTKA